MSDNHKNGCKSAAFALGWVFLITLAAFPDLFDNVVEFSQRVCTFEKIGRTVFLVLIVYIFDILVEVAFSLNRLVYIKNYFLSCFALFILVCVFMQFAIINLWNPVLLILLVDLPMATMKGVSLHYIFNKKRRTKELIILVQER
ncbi:MAG: hypothetical protein LBD45_09270 [Bacteroidales bacterium]|jgi:hypothetical protein|nr:hypothetical protein [Bacteroidales bacterium]